MASTPQLHQASKARDGGHELLHEQRSAHGKRCASYAQALAHGMEYVGYELFKEMRCDQVFVPDVYDGHS